MTVRLIIPGHYEMSAGDTPPTTDVRTVSTVREIDTNRMWITYDGGAHWIEADKRIRLVSEAGAFVDLVTPIAAIQTAVQGMQSVIGAVGATASATGELLAQQRVIAEALAKLNFTDEDLQVKTYAFSLGGVNFNDYTKIKTLWLPSNASTTHVNLQFEGADYVIPGNSIFIGLKISGYIFPGAGQTFGFFGEGLITDNIVQHILSFSGGDEKCFMFDVMGVFGAHDNKYIKAGTDNSNVPLYANSALYGVEVVVS